MLQKPNAADLLANNLIAVLRDEDRAFLAARMERLELQPGDKLFHAGEIVRNAYFPCGCALASFIVFCEPAVALEAALVGREGAIGGIVSNGNLHAYANAEVQVGGTFLSIATADLERAKSESIYLRHWLTRYADCLLAQVFQSAACNASHSVAQRTSKWLLAVIDRTGNGEISLTQQRLAEMLGVGRSFTSRVLQDLKKSGVIEAKRGIITVRNVKLLSRLSCDCDRRLKQHFEAVLRGVYPENGTA